MVLKLFNKQSIFSLVDILFKDMYEDGKMLLDPSESDESDEYGDEESEENMEFTDSETESDSEDDNSRTSKSNSISIPHKGGKKRTTISQDICTTQSAMDGDDESSDEESEEEEVEYPTRYGVDIEDYIGRKGLLAIERIKDIVGEIMATCAKNMKYQILEYIMKGVVFDKKTLRESFLQEILHASGSASFANAIENYINANGMTILLGESNKKKI